LIIKENKKNIKQLEKNPTPNWDNFVSKLEECDEKLSRAWSQINHLNAVINSPDLRSEYNNNVTKITKYYSELSQNEKLFLNFKKIKQSKEFKKLSATRQKIINDELLGFKLGGIGLSENKKKIFKKIKVSLSKLSSKFEENILDATNNYYLNIIDKNDLLGLPDFLINDAKKRAVEKKKSGWIFTLDYPSYFPFMQYADNRKLRENFYHAYSTRASELGDKKFDNKKNINEILKLKHQLAKLIGYKNYSEVSLATKMASSSNEVINFLDKLAKKARPYAVKDMNDLKKHAQKYGIKKIEAWDVSFLSEKLRNEIFNFKDSEIKQFFPRKKVMSGLFQLVHKLYGISIIKKKADTWHKDVEFYEIKDKVKNVIGYFYLDLFARENKRGGAWMDECISKYKFNDEISNPIAYLTCNFSSPSGNKDAYFTHDEVITLFHEFGHGLHHLLTDITDYSVSGIRGVEWDAVELPSQFMENFCWDWQVIKSMTEHEHTKKQMPKNLFDKLISAKNFQSGLQTLRQVEFALYDIKLHMKYSSNHNYYMNLLHKVRREIAVVIPPKSNRFPNNFSHIFAGGYAAGYFSYKWAEVLSADVYSEFEKYNVLSPKIGAKFKNEVLSRGGSRPMMKSFIAFLGRKPKIDSLLKYSGLS